CRPPPPRLDSSGLPEDQREEDEAEGDSIDHEGHERVPPEVAHQEPDRGPAGEEGREQRGRERTPVAGGQAVPQHVERLEPARPRGDRDTEQEREPSGRRPVEAAEEPRGDRDTRARGPRDQREGLRAPDQQGLPPADVPLAALASGAGPGEPVGGEHDESPREGREGDDDGEPEVRLDQVVEEHADEAAGDRGRAQEEAEPAHAARATSSGVVRRPLGLRRRATSLIVSWPGIFWRAGVSVTPARIEFAVIPRGASSEASCRMWDSRAALAAETGPYWGSTRAPPDEIIAKMRPPRPISPRPTTSCVQ